MDGRDPIFPQADPEWDETILAAGDEQDVGKKGDEEHGNGTPPAVSEQLGDNMEGCWMSLRTVELPMFDGNVPVGWITRSDTYFEVENTSEEVKITQSIIELIVIGWSFVTQGANLLPRQKKIAPICMLA